MNNNIIIQYLYLDLDLCTRCQATEQNLNAALDQLKVLYPDHKFLLELIHIDSLEKAIAHQLVSSPTIRINGNDIAVKLVETKCGPCGDLAGTEVDCRAWEYQGKLYDDAPAQLIVDSVVDMLSRNQFSHYKKHAEYVVPSNIKEFFSSKKKCCSSTKCGC